jgi:F-type H+-transporting ATPase subunit b
MEKLGIEPVLLLAQIINFTIIVLVLKKFLYKPILDLLAKRKQEIDEGLALTQKMRQEEEKMKAKEAKLMDTARKDALDILENAKKDAKNVSKQIVADAHEEANAIITKAKAETQILEDQLRQNLEREAIELASVMTKRLVGSVLGADQQHKLIEKHIKSLKSL